MSKIIDLDAIIAKTYKIKLFGELINVNQPTISTVKKFSSMANIENEEDALDKYAELVVEILNNNTSGAKFTKNKIMALPQAVLTAIMETISSGIEEVDENPN